MKNLINLKSFSLISILMTILICWSCDNEVDPKYLPVVETSATTMITEATAISGGNITADGGNEVIARGVCWNIQPNPTITDSITKDAAGTGRFISKISV